MRMDEEPERGNRRVDDTSDPGESSQHQHRLILASDHALRPMHVFWFYGTLEDPWLRLPTPKLDA